MNLEDTPVAVVAKSAGADASEKHCLGCHHLARAALDIDLDRGSGFVLDLDLGVGSALDVVIFGNAVKNHRIGVFVKINDHFANEAVATGLDQIVVDLIDARHLTQDGLETDA